MNVNEKRKKRKMMFERVSGRPLRPGGRVGGKHYYIILVGWCSEKE